MDDRFNHVSEAVILLDRSGKITDTNAPVSQVLGRDRSTLIGSDVDDALPESAQPLVVSPDEWLDSESEFVDFFPTLDRWLEISTVTTDTGPTLYVRDVTDRQRRRRDLEACQTEVETLAQINETISDMLGALVKAGSREEIEQTICERLGESELYRFAWIGEPVLGDEGVMVRASADDTGDVLERIQDGFDGEPPPPEQRALETGTIHRVTGLAEKSAAPEPIQRAAFARGLYSCLAVPLSYGSTVYGVLGIYTDRQDALTDRERESFEALGRIAGFAINATHQRNLVLSDTVIELAYRIADRSSVLVDASARVESPLVVEGVVPVGDGELLAYVSVSDVSASTLAAALEPETDVRSVHGEDGSLTEIRPGGTTALSLLADLGGTIRAAEYEDGSGKLIVEVPPQEDVRAIDRRLDDAFDDVGLLAKRERERAVETTGEFRRALRDRLTERQLTVLKAAYLADYFESPRGSTSSEIAEALGITSPTLLHHLRAAERKLLNAFFDELDPADHHLELIDRSRDR